MNTFTDTIGTAYPAHSAQRDAGTLVARLLLAALFLISGLAKVGAAEGTSAYIASAGLPFPELLYWITLAVEVIGGVLLIVGYKTRYAALVLGLFTLAAAVFFHADFADQMQFTNFLKNLSIAGGMFMVALFGPGRYSVDRG